jgi:trigger factor
MQVTREDINPCTVKLTIACEPAQVQEGFNKAFKQISKKIRLPGFRPGHAPRSVLEKYVPKEEVAEEAVDGIVRQALKSAIESQGITPDPTTVPMVDITKFEAENDIFEFVAKIPLPATVELGDTKGLVVEEPKVEVTEDEVKYQLDELRQRRSTREAVTDRGVQDGDVCVVNIKLDEGGTAEGRNFMVVAGQTFPQLDTALAGMQIEEMKSLELAFPDNFQEKDWASKTLKTRVTINSVSAVKLPEVDEAFAQALKTESVEDLQARLRDGIGRAKDQMVAEMVSEQLFDRLLERSKVEVSDNMWENLANRRLQEMAEEQGKEGKTLETYAQENGMTIESFIAAQNGNAKASVIRALLIKEVFIQEKMGLTNGDLNDALLSMAAEYNLPPEEMLNLITKSQAADELRFRAMAKKVSDFLGSNAEVKEVAEPGAEPAAAPKKKSAKK